MNKKPFRNVMITFLAVLVLSAVFSSLPVRKVMARPAVVEIRPTSGTVGTPVSVNGTIDTPNGPYTIRWNQLTNITTGTADGTNASTSFIVPSTPGALAGRNISVELIDDVAGIIAATNFTLLTKLLIGVEAPSLPKQLLEGSGVRIWANVTGGEAGRVYTANVTVKNPANQTYFALATLSNTTVTGEGWASKTYPVAFGTGANTNFVGKYVAALNETTAQEFSVGLTDKLEYEIGETVQMQATGYKSAETVRVEVKSGSSFVSGFPTNSTATASGEVHVSWTVPQNAILGTYTIFMTNATDGGTVKSVKDAQEFEVVGFVCNVHTGNLAGESVDNALVEVYNATAPSSLLVKGNTNSTGWVKFNLKGGSYDFKAFFKETGVGNRSNVQVTEDVSLEIELRLVDVRASVKTGTGEKVPFVQILLKYNYTTRVNQTMSGSASMTANMDGIAQTSNLLTNTTYMIQALRYGMPFSNKTISIEPTPAIGRIELDLIVPTYTLNIHGLDSSNSDARGVVVKTYEWSAGVAVPLRSVVTNESGYVSVALIFGRYILRAYMDDVLLNETAVDLFQDNLLFTFYFRTAFVNVGVTVLDYLGQPLPSANVTVERRVGEEYLFAYSQLTGPDGRTLFASKAGGESRISVYVNGRLAKVKTQFLGTGAEDVVFSLGEYIVIVGNVVDTGLFGLFCFILVVVAIILVLGRGQLQRAIVRRRGR